MSAHQQNRTQTTFWEFMRRIMAAKLSNKTLNYKSQLTITTYYHSLYYNMECKIVKKVFSLMIEWTVDSQISTPILLASWASKCGQNLLKVFDYTCIRPKNNPLKVSNRPIFDEFWGFLIKKIHKFNRNWPYLSLKCHNSPSDTKIKRLWP